MSINIEPQKIIDPIINVIYDHIETVAAKERPRNYIGASSIGEECELRLWLKYRHADKAMPRTAKLILAANDGHRGEDLAACYLRQVPGVELWTHQDGKQYGFVDFEGEFKGHIDGIIKGIPLAPTTTHIWENKVCNEKKYNELKKIVEKHGMKEALYYWDYKYYCQAVINMDYFDIERHYMTVWLAGSRALQTIRTNSNKELAEQLKAKAQRIIKAQTPPIGISQNPNWYKCKPEFCEFSENCPSINPNRKALYA